MLKRFRLYLLWSCAHFFGDPTSEVDFLCQAGEHTYSKSDLEKDVRTRKRKTTIDGEVFIVYKGYQKCLGNNCEVTRRAWQEIYQDLDGKAHPSFCKELNTKAEQIIDHLPR